MLKRLLMPFAIACLILPIFQASHADLSKQASAKWEGVWFSCEFAQRQRAPDDGCAMFDDEGFYFADGTLYHVRMQGSRISACRGNKKGQCFKRDTPAISATQKAVADLTIEGDRLIARYWGCEQGYIMQEGPEYMTIKPLAKNCFWSQERHFYIAPYEGQLTIVNP